MLLIHKGQNLKHWCKTNAFLISVYRGVNIINIILTHQLFDFYLYINVDFVLIIYKDIIDLMLICKF